MEKHNNKSCVDCAWFCFWDGDWCCSRNMEIISMGDEHGAAVTPESVTNHEPCGDFELDTEEGIAYNRSIWRNINGIEDTYYDYSEDKFKDNPEQGEPSKENMS